MKKITLLLLMSLFYLSGYSQLVLEGFESTTGPDALPSTNWTLGSGNWAVFDNGVGLGQRWDINTTNVCVGNQIAYMNREFIGQGNTSEDYLATPLTLIPTNGELHFQTRTFTSNNQGTIFQIKVAPATASQTNPAAYTLIQQWDETTLTAVYNVCEEKVVNLSAYAGQQIYVSFVQVFTQPTAVLGGDRWLVDNVSINTRCLVPTTLTATGITFNGANLNWANPSGATSWEIEVVPVANTPTGVGVVYSGPLPYPVTGLLPNTTYKYYVRALCSTGYTSAWSTVSSNFTTAVAPPICGGNFIDSGGIAGNYANNANITTTINPVTPGDVVTVTFTAFNTQAGFDILNVYNGPNATFPLIASLSGTNIPGSITSSAANGSLTFVFTSNATTVAAGWQSNVTCAPPPTCPKPILLTTSNILPTSVTLGWTNVGPATAWQVLALPCTSPAPTASSTGWVDAPTNPFNLTGLTSASCYNLYVRGVCSPTDSSEWGGPIVLNTPVAPPVCGGNFVDSGGTTGAYQNNENQTTVITPTIPGQQVTVTFTAFATENCCDHLSIYDGPSAASPLLGTFQGTALPPTFTGSSASGALTFVFTSDISVTAAGWVANITCAPAPVCPKPTALTTTALLSTSVIFGWTNNGPATSWQVLALPCGSPAPTAASTGWTAATTNPFTLTGLTPSTCYDLYVRGDCDSSSNGVSLWSGPKTVTTQNAPPVCGGVFVDSGGSTAVYQNNENITTTICATNPGDIVTITFTSFATENCCDHLSIYDGNSNTAPLLGTFQGTALPPSFTSSAANGCLTFVFTSDISITAAGWIANVTCAPGPNCPRPTALTATNITSTSALLSWTEPTPAVQQWEILVLPFGSPVPLPTATGTIVSINPALFTGLTPATQYTFYVRSICPTTGTSLWSVGANFTTLIINDECSGAIFTPVNSTSVCQQVTSGTITGATASTPGTTAPCVGTANDDVWFQFVATNPYVSVSLLNVLGSTTNLNFGVYSGVCGTLTQIFCSPANTLTAIVNSLTVGQTYYIRVYSNGNTAQTTTFDLCVATPSSCLSGQTACGLVNSTPSTVGVVPGLGTIGCLGTSPNPNFYTIQIQNTGAINFLLAQSSTPGGTPDRDVDYAAWGPFTSQSAACAAIGNPPTLAPGIGVPVTQQTGCSFSANPTETLNITNAVAGQYYIVLITNYSNQPGFITFTQTNTGTPGSGLPLCCADAYFSYVPSTFCLTPGAPNPTPIIAQNSVAGTFSVSPASPPGLVFANTATGEIDLANSVAGNYVILNTVAPTSNCVEQKQRSYTVSLVTPVVANISYPLPATYCKSITTPVPVTQTGVTGGTYAVSPNGGLSINTITGAITPSLSAPGIYTITYSLPGSTVCSSTNPQTTVEILAPQIPTFTQVAPICPGGVLADLPTISLEGITGTWSPAMNNTATTTYTFTPTTDTCAGTTTMTIGVGSTTPVFTQVAPICPGALLADLPTTSINGVTGTWSPPVMDNTITTTYTFTPTPGLCSGAVQMTIQVLTPTIVPTFTSVAPICPNGIIANLPTTSNNGITGVWFPALNNTATTIYTFTPDTAQCALTTTLTIIVNPELVVTVNNPSFCPGSTATVTATPAIPGSYTYDWTVPTGATNPGNVASFNTSIVGTYSVVITQTNNFCNTDFESPTATGAFPNLFNENLVPCWDTTAADGIIEIWPPGFEGVTAYSGNQLIELNANLVGTLFQDFNVIPGTSIAISFAHRGRQGNDVVGVEVGPVGGPYVSLGNFTDGNTAWGLHSVNYTIPTGNGNNYTLRFVSVSSTGGNQSVGNLLDSISISSLSCPSQSASGIVTLQTLPDPTVTVTQPTCAVQTGTIEVTSPLATGGITPPADLFISEVTDESTGSLSYIEIYNGTGVSKNLANYKLKVYNNGNPGPSNFCDFPLSGTLNNNSVYVVAVGSATNQGGVVPNLVVSACAGFNTNDNVRLATIADVEFDLWGRTDGIDFTPANQSGYTYRRIASAPHPTMTWNPVDWTALDPQDYTNVGSYTPLTVGYEYSLDNGTYQASTTFTGVLPGNHTITVHDLNTGCYSLPFNVTINPVPQNPSVTTISYTTPVCQNATTNPVPDTSATGFTIGGTYTSNPSTGIDLNASTGEINLANTTAGTYIITYAVLGNPATCIQAGSSTSTIVINPIVTPVTTISYAMPVCINGVNPTPDTSAPGFTFGGTYTSTTGISIDSTTGVINLATSTTGTYIVTYTVNANPGACQVAHSDTFAITLDPIVTPGTAFSYTTPVCPGGNNVFPLPGTGFTNGGLYSSTNGLDIDSDTGEIDLTTSTPGTYTITYAVGANSAICQVANTGTAVIVISSPIEVSVAGDCVGVAYTLTASPIGNSFNPTAVTYSWEDSSGNPVGGNTQSVVVTSEGDYTVTVVSDGCSGSAMFTADAITCVIQKGISVNSTPDGLNDCMDLVGYNVKKLSIFNRYGMKVYSRGGYTNQWCGQSDNGDQLPDGTYYYVIERDNGETKTGWIYINKEI